MLASKRGLLLLWIGFLSAVAIAWICLTPRGDLGLADHSNPPTAGPVRRLESESPRIHQREIVRTTAAYRLQVVDDLGQAVVGASIRVHRPQAIWIPSDARSLGTTDTAGELAIGADEAGSHLYAVHPGWVTGGICLPAARDGQLQNVVIRLRRAVFQYVLFRLADGSPVADQIVCASKASQDAVLDEEPPGLSGSWPGADEGAVYTSRSDDSGRARLALPQPGRWSMVVLPHDHLAVHRIEPKAPWHMPGPTVDVTLAPLYGALVCIQGSYVSYQAALDIHMGNAGQRQLQMLARRLEKRAESQLDKSDMELKAWVGFARPGKRPGVRLRVLWPSGDTSEHVVPMQLLSEGGRLDPITVAPAPAPLGAFGRMSVEWTGVAAGPEMVLRGPVAPRAKGTWSRTVTPGREYAMAAGDYVIECLHRADRDVMPGSRFTVGRERETVKLTLPQDVGVCRLKAMLPNAVPASRVTLRISRNGSELWVRHLQRAHGVHFLLRHGDYDVILECEGCESVRRYVQVNPTEVCEIEVMLPWSR